MSNNGKRLSKKDDHEVVMRVPDAVEMLGHRCSSSIYHAIASGKLHASSDPKLVAKRDVIAWANRKNQTFSLRSAGRYVDVHYVHIASLAEAGKIPFTIKKGSLQRTYRQFARQDLDAYVAQRRSSLTLRQVMIAWNLLSENAAKHIVLTRGIPHDFYKGNMLVSREAVHDFQKHGVNPIAGLLSQSQVAGALGHSAPSSVSRLLKSGAITAVADHGRFWVNPKDIPALRNQ